MNFTVHHTCLYLILGTIRWTGWMTDEHKYVNQHRQLDQRYDLMCTLKMANINNI